MYKCYHVYLCEVRDALTPCGARMHRGCHAFMFAANAHAFSQDLFFFVTTTLNNSPPAFRHCKSIVRAPPHFHFADNYSSYSRMWLRPYTGSQMPGPDPATSCPAIWTSRCPQGKEIRNAYQSSIPAGGGVAPSAYAGLLPHTGVPIDLGLKKQWNASKVKWHRFVFKKKPPQLNSKNTLVIRTLPGSHILHSAWPSS